MSAAENPETKQPATDESEKQHAGISESFVEMPYRDDSGGVDTYIMPEVNAHHDGPYGGVHKDGYFKVARNRYIYKVTYKCEGEFCGWCYNPDGGYSMWCQIIEGGTKAHWRRFYDGRPVRETYKVYWKKL